MLDKVRRNAFLIAAVFFLWQGWSSANAAPEVDENADGVGVGVGVEVKVPSIQQSFLRGASASDLDAPQDPFALLKRALAAQVAADEENQGGGSVRPASSPVASRAKLILGLESTMHANHRWIARINGHLLRVGDSLPGLDKKQPPVLVFVQGTVAKLRYAGKIIRLDMAGEASVSVD